MRHFLDEENLDALGVRCWPEMPNTFGQWPYLGMARLADEGVSAIITDRPDLAARTRRHLRPTDSVPRL